MNSPMGSLVSPELEENFTSEIVRPIVEDHTKKEDSGVTDGLRFEEIMNFRTSWDDPMIGFVNRMVTNLRNFGMYNAQTQRCSLFRLRRAGEEGQCRVSQAALLPRGPPEGVPGDVYP